MVVNVEDAGFEIRDQIMWVYGSGFPKNHNLGDGLGTVLKPAHEPIVMARKPISEKTIKANVIRWGTGGINIDASRVPSDDSYVINTFDGGAKPWGDASGEAYTTRTASARFPANFIHDGSQEVLDLFPDSNGSGGVDCGTGSAARFFYCAKANKKEKGADNIHPTVKPIKLMTYLINLVTPPDGTVLDPFMGSGTTGVACKTTGNPFIGIERDPEYFTLAQTRIN
jgi:site-specific DNA-methyltransferase (adenine-specific)